MSSKHSRVRFQMSNWIYHNSTGAPGPPHNISFCLSIHSSLAQPDCVAATYQDKASFGYLGTDAWINSDPRSPSGTGPKLEHPHGRPHSK